MSRQRVRLRQAKSQSDFVLRSEATEERSERLGGGVS